MVHGHAAMVASCARMKSIDDCIVVRKATRRRRGGGLTENGLGGNLGKLAIVRDALGS